MFRVFVEENDKEIKEKIKDIKIYQGDIKRAEKELGSLKEVDTGSAETFLRESLAYGVGQPRTYFLRIRAYQLGADAIIHYAEERNSCMGTPVEKKSLR